MPTDARPLSMIQAVADLQRQARRQMNRNVGGTPIWEFDTFTITGAGDTTHTLTWLPYGINVVLLNGLGLVEGTDYSCAYTTGVVTVTATLTAGDILHVRYVTTGDLMVFGTPPDTGAITDNFNRTAGAFTSANWTTTTGAAHWTDTSPASSSFGIDGATSKANSITSLGGGGTADLSVTTSSGTIQADLTGQYSGGISGGSAGFIVLRDATGANNVTMYFPGYHAALLVNGTQVWTNTYGPASGVYTITATLVFSTTSLALSINGTAVYSTTTSLPTAPGNGVRIFALGASCGVDNFSLV